MNDVRMQPLVIPTKKAKDQGQPPGGIRADEPVRVVRHMDPFEAEMAGQVTTDLPDFNAVGVQKRRRKEEVTVGIVEEPFRGPEGRLPRPEAGLPGPLDIRGMVKKLNARASTLLVPEAGSEPQPVQSNPKGRSQMPLVPPGVNHGVLMGNLQQISRSLKQGKTDDPSFIPQIDTQLPNQDQSTDDDDDEEVNLPLSNPKRLRGQKTLQAGRRQG
eukprot:TRINITY_DN3178_c0_g1_i4.p1 TRINITY_DN3178_c0_g1~~TRINITY_DN3178_c0_g1_i4.p1  ORF type:complete len:215 (-),score=61.38 TRINITY_DN3178_c0_g1_i4:100-744(-)